MKGLLAALQKVVTVNAAPDRFSFSCRGRAATVETAVRVAENGRVLGFGADAEKGSGRTTPLFGPGRGQVDENVLTLLCRRGFREVLSPGVVLRPRVIVHGAAGAGIPHDLFARALRSAGAASVEFVD